MRHSKKGLEVIARYFYDTYVLKNVGGNPFLKPGEEIDHGQQLQVQASTDHIAYRLDAEGVTLVDSAYEPIPHDQWEVGELVINVRTGSVARLSHRKTFPDNEPFPGWWLEGSQGGIADFASDWRSLKCLLAERQHLGL